MTKRLKRLLATGAALAALAVGSAAFAAAQQPGHTNASDHRVATKVEQVGGQDGDNVQEGDQSAPDNSGSGQTEQSGSDGSEQTGAEAETAPGNDGPGGHADEIGGNANANHQFEGTE
jgi:hypothetical protein